MKEKTIMNPGGDPSAPLEGHGGVVKLSSSYDQATGGRCPIHPLNGVPCNTCGSPHQSVAEECSASDRWAYYADVPRPFTVVCTDDTAWGNPRLNGTRLQVVPIAGRFAAGETIAAIANDYAIAPSAIEEMLRAVVAATFGRQGMLEAVHKRLEAAARENLVEPER